jgi:hypothetical protein
MKKNRNLMMAAALIAVTVSLSLTACASGPSPEELRQREAKRQQQSQELIELDSWKKEASRIINELEKLDGGKTYADVWKRFYQSIDFSAWMENKSVCQATLQGAKDWIAMEPARQAERDKVRAEQEKAAEEQRVADAKTAEEHRAVIAAANAKGVTAADFEYDINGKGDGIVIKRYKGLATVVNIPAVIEGFPVKELGLAFSGNREITSVTIPDSVTDITNIWPVRGYSGHGEIIDVAAGVFRGCTSLTSVTLSRNMKHIGVAMFQDCISLETIILPASLTSINHYAFRGCRALKTITFPDSITEIETGAFEGCTALTTLILPQKLMVLGHKGYDNNWSRKENAGEVFIGCTSLASVTFQSNVWIGHGTFAGCTALSTLTINGNISLVARVTYARSPFEDCPITTVNIGPNVFRIENVRLIPQDNLSIADKAALNRVTVRNR